jgi:hypothetical protein
MLKVIGGVTLVAGLAIGAAVYFGWADVDAEAALTSKGKAEIQGVRNELAEKVRGGEAPHTP